MANNSVVKLSGHKTVGTRRKLPFECVALLLQGGGALGAYQAGVYQALDESGIDVNWVGGISIGAINAAIIAGNLPGKRIERLRAFWEMVTNDTFQYVPMVFKHLFGRSNSERQMLNETSAFNTLLYGVKGFFQPRFLTPLLAPKGTLQATSFYNTDQLKTTLEKLIDFNLLNKGDIRLSVGAVHVESGNFINFDTGLGTIGPEHILASGALPPGLPAVEIEGEYFWDGGLISNTPLRWVIEDRSRQDTLVFQVDLWSANGEFPQNMADVMTRQKDIQFSSRTRANTDRFREQHELRHNIDQLLKKLPDNLKNLPEVKKLSKQADSHVYNIVHLIYHNAEYEGYSKDFEFSRLSMEAHWQKGYDDTLKTLKNPKVLERPHNQEGIETFDLYRQKRIPEIAAAAT